MLLVIGAVVAALAVIAAAAGPRERGRSCFDEYCSMECADVRQSRLNSCC